MLPVRLAPPVRRVQGRQAQRGRWDQRVPVEAQQVQPVQREQRALGVERRVRQDRWVLLAQRVRLVLLVQTVPQDPPALLELMALRGRRGLLDLLAALAPLAHRDRLVHKDWWARPA